MSIRYAVDIGQYARRHYIKSFEKKYGRAWDITIEALIQEFQNFDVLLGLTIAEKIAESGDVKICKVEFKIAGSEKSRHGSGNRCIVAVHKDTNKIDILLVYHKNYLGEGHETMKWKQIVVENYPQYAGLF
ncbi:MAG: hypothetical protein AAB791_01465 [Patescibacteria group bacterium]